MILTRVSILVVELFPYVFLRAYIAGDLVSGLTSVLFTKLRDFAMLILPDGDNFFDLSFESNA